MSKVRISLTPSEFNKIIVNGDNRLQSVVTLLIGTYAKYYGISDDNAAKFHAYRLQWDTPVTGVYDLFTNPETSNSIIKKKTKQFIKEFRAFANPLLNVIAASENATATEEGIFNLVLFVNRKKPTKTHTKIKSQCLTSLISEKGGNLKAESRSDSDAKRASVAEGADGVQYAYTIMDDDPKTIAARTTDVVNKNNANSTARLANPTVQAYALIPLPVPVPQHPDDGTTKEFFSGATHEFSFGATNEGNYLCEWSRWYNSKHPNLAGDWSEMQTVLLG